MDAGLRRKEGNPLNQRQPRLHDPGYLKWLRKMPCCVCHKPAPCDAAHVKSASPLHGKPSSGTAKPDDRWAVPLCRSCHTMQHNRGDELAHWKDQRINPFMLSTAYYHNYGGTGGEPKKPRKIAKRKPKDQRQKIQTAAQRWRKSLRMQSKLKRKVSGEVVLR